jgi:hypothetical protein
MEGSRFGALPNGPLNSFQYWMGPLDEATGGSRELPSGLQLYR